MVIILLGSLLFSDIMLYFLSYLLVILSYITFYS